jgi:hypothetical protein
MIFWITHNSDAPTIPADYFALGYRVFGVVSALGVNIGFERDQKFGNRGLVEDGN